MKPENQHAVPALAVKEKLLPDSTRIEYAEFRVTNIKASLHFYENLVGLKKIRTDGDRTFLSASSSGEPLVVLKVDRDARPRPSHSAGLFHLALLYPTRKDLAAAFKRMYEHGWQFHGFADHGVSEALYMSDAEGNGIELYRDLPREQWPYKNGELEMVTEPLDLDDLLSEFSKSSAEQATSGVTIGHIHLQVTNLQSAERFYHSTLGFDVTQRTFPGALFLAAGGYHHHIGLNVWNTQGGSPMAEQSTGLVRFGIRTGRSDAVQAIVDRLRKTSYRFTTMERGILVHDTDNIQMEII